MRNKLLLCLVLTMFFFQFCSRSHERSMTEKEIHDTEEALIDANRLMIIKDKEKILSYIQNHHLDLTETGSGLWYGIIRPGNGGIVKNKMVVTLAYKVSLLDGTMCYDSDSLGLKKFRVGTGGVESGLEEGVLLLKEGCRALFIMPPHLAHGITGDGNKIPARSIIRYDIELLKVEP